MQLRILAVGFITVLAVGACEDSSGESSNPVMQAYANAIQRVVGADPFVDLEEPRTLVVWVYPLEPGAFGDDLEVQVGVLDVLEDFATVRFIDAFEEAVHEKEEGSPVIDDGIAVGLGTFEPGDLRLEVERYESDDRRPVDLLLERADGRWLVAERDT